MDKMTPAEFETEVALPPLSNADLCDVLNDLIQACRDAERGYEQAARDADSSSLKSTFWRLANQRAEFIGELQAWILRLGGTPGAGGTVKGALRRGWADVRSVIARRSDDAIVADCRRGDEATTMTYEEAADRPLPLDLQAVVERQLDAIRAARSAVVGM